MNHTPTPWSIEQTGLFHGIVGCDSRPIAEMFRVGSSYAQQDATDAAFIVRAVNSHAALVTALRKLLEEGTHREVETGIGMAIEPTEAFAQAQHALALAEGKD